MRCPDCNTFVPYDTEVEPEESGDPEMDGTTFRVSYDRILNCENCGTELKRATIEITKDVGELPDCDENDNMVEHEWEFDLEASPTTGSITIDRHGKKITNPRYMKTTYGVEVSGTATCETCHKEITIEASGEEVASAFDESV